MEYVTQCDIAMLLNVLIIPTNVSLRQIDLKFALKFEINIVLYFGATL